MSQFRLLFIISLFAICSNSISQKNVIYICSTDLITGDPYEFEAPVIDAIKEANGGNYYNVTLISPDEVPSNIETLNSADVVIVGRSVSSSYVLSDSIIYRGITAPVIHTSPWVIRGDRFAYVTGGTEHQNTDATKIVYGNVQNASHPVFDGITLDGESVSWTEGYTTDLQPETGVIKNGTVLAKTSDNRILLVVYDKGVALNNGTVTQGRRAYMGNGQDNVEPFNYWNYTDNSKKIFINLIDFMTDLFGECYNNTAPIVTNSIADTTINAGFSSFTIDFDDVFYDANGDNLSYSATSSNESVVTVTNSANELIVNEAGLGTSTITITATDNCGESATLQFSTYTNPSQKNIIYVVGSGVTGSSEGEKPIIDTLKARSFNVTIEQTGYTEINKEKMNAADLIIIGRSANSSEVLYSADLYDEVTTPIIYMSPYVVRWERASLVSAMGSESVIDNESAVVQGIINSADADNRIFTGVSTGTIDWWTGYYSILSPEALEINASLVVKTSDNRILLSMHDANVPFLEGGRTPAGQRAYIGNGQDKIGTTYFNFTDNAKTIFFNLIDSLSGRSEWIGNTKPEISTQIEDTTLYEDFDTLNIYLPNIFEDADNDALQFSAESSNNNVINLEISGDTLIIKEVGLGSCSVTVSAYDKSGEMVSQQFSVTVLFRPKNMIFLYDGNWGSLEYEKEVLDAIKNYNNGTTYNITEFDHNNFTTAFVDSFNKADIIIIGRTVESSDIDYNTWDQITAPVVIMSPWVARKGKSDMFPIETAFNIDIEPNEYLEGHINDLNNPIFKGIDKSTINWWSNDYSILDPITQANLLNGEIFVQSATGQPLLTIFEANKPFHSTSSHTPAGVRAYIGNGCHVEEPVIYFNFTDTAKTIFFNVLDNLSGNSTSIEDYKNNDLPAVASELEDIYVNRGFRVMNIDLSPIFEDANGDSLTYSAICEDGESVTASVVGNTLTITEVEPGITSIQVYANDGYANYGTKVGFKIRVNSIPTMQNPIPNDTLLEGFSKKIIDLTNVFEDADDQEVLSYTVNNSNDYVVRTSINGTNLEINEFGIGQSTITVTVTDGYEGTATNEFIVVVNELAGINKNNTESLIVFPNPTKGNVYISAPQYQNGQFVGIYNIDGKQVYFNNFNSELTVDMSSYEKGVYFLKLIKDQTTIAVKKIIVEE